MTISNIAAWLQIATVIVGVGGFIIASISKKSRKWFKSIISECLQDLIKSKKDDEEK